MDWFFLALLGTSLNGSSALVHKYLISNKVKSPLVFMFLNGLANLCCALLLLSFWIELNYQSLFAGFIVGTLWFIWTFAFYKALAKEEVSRVQTLYQIRPLFILGLAILFLGEGKIIGLYECVGIFLMVAGAILISLKKTGKKFHLSKALIWIFVGVSTSAGVIILMKYFLGFTPYIEVLFWMLIWAGMLGLIFLFPFCRKEIRLDRSLAAGFLGASLLVTIGSLLYFKAVSLGPASLVGTVSTAQPLIMILLIMVIGCLFRKDLLEEDLTKKTIGLKVLAATLIIVGLLLVR